MDDHVINMREYLERRPSGATYFSVYGGEGARARFALPTWRALNLLQSDRAGLFLMEAGSQTAHPLFILDLGAEEAREDFDLSLLPKVPVDQAPSIADDGPGNVAIFLGREEGDRLWYMILSGPEVGGSIDAAQREELMFFAGECAGLLLHQHLASESGEGVGDP